MTDRPVTHRTTNVTKRDRTDTPGTTTVTDATDTTPMNNNTTARDTQAGTNQTVREMDHTPPVEGARRTFERRDEGRPPRADGGKPDEHEGTADEENEATADGGFSQKMKEMDHTPPVDGANRTFERGKDDGDEDGDVGE